MTLEEALAALDRTAPGFPLLALGQTIFWDEPMKAGVAQAVKRGASGRTFIAGVHDTDYFAKAPGKPKKSRQKFQIVPHNDTTTRGLWSAAGEFSSLFGSETVVTREMLGAAGLRFRRLTQMRPNFLDEATEAWGWRGIVSLAESPPVAADVPAKEICHDLEQTLRWALDQTLECIPGSDRSVAEARADEFVGLLCDSCESQPNGTLSDLYETMLRGVFEFAASSSVELGTTRTSRLLKFNRSTSALPRFELLDRFIRPATAEAAKAAYDEVGAGSGIYGLSRFGTGAIPFDVYLPGIGRGTLRIGNRGIVINTPNPQFASLKRPVTSACELAEVLEARFGPEIAIVGKAVTLIGMLAKEFVFVFHEGASSYVAQSRKLHEKLGITEINPILRVKYDAWSAMSCSCSWFRLPEPMRRPFGADELCSQSFASRWQSVAREQAEFLAKLGSLKSPLELIGILDQVYGGSWRALGGEYQRLQVDLQSLRDELSTVREQRIELYKERNRLKQSRRDAEKAMGDQFRAHVFGVDATPEALAERERLSGALESIKQAQEEVQTKLRHAFRSQRDLAANPTIQAAHARRNDIEVEAELMRCKIIREAVMASKGLEHASHRPSAWWFPLVSPDGLWFRETVDSAEAYLEPLC